MLKILKHRAYRLHVEASCSKYRHFAQNAEMIYSKVETLIHVAIQNFCYVPQWDTGEIVVQMRNYLQYPIMSHNSNLNVFYPLVK